MRLIIHGHQCIIMRIIKKIVILKGCYKKRLFCVLILFKVDVENCNLLQLNVDGIKYSGRYC